MVVFSPIFVADTKIIYGYDFVAPLTLDAFHICGALRDLVPFVQFKLREKYPWRSVNFSKVAGLLKLTLLHGCFSSFLSCTNGTKSPNASHKLFWGFTGLTLNKKWQLGCYADSFSRGLLGSCLANCKNRDMWSQKIMSLLVCFSVDFSAK